MKILIADDHPLVRESMHHIMERLRSEAEIIEAQDFPSTFDAIAQHGNPDLILLDLDMPGSDPFEGLKTLTDLGPETTIVILSASESPDDVRAALDLGVQGYIPKSSSPQVILAALQLVLSGGTYVPPNLMRDCEKNMPAARPTQTLLTPRQREVASLMARGQTNKELARELGLSEGTVRTHVAAILLALDVSNRTEASHVARKLGLI